SLVMSCCPLSLGSRATRVTPRYRRDRPGQDRGRRCCFGAGSRPEDHATSTFATTLYQSPRPSESTSCRKTGDTGVPSCRSPCLVGVPVLSEDRPAGVHVLSKSVSRRRPFPIEGSDPTGDTVLLESMSSRWPVADLLTPPSKSSYADLTTAARRPIPV